MSKQIRRFIKSWLLPPRLAASFRVLGGVLRSRRLTEPISRRSDKIFVLANGPSLTKDLVRYADEISKNDCMVLNFMALSDAYSRIKPSVYILADALFFLPLEKIPTMCRANVERMIEIWKAQSWPMTLVVPNEARGSELLSKLPETITVRYYLSSPCPLPEDDNVKGWISGRLAPPGQTVTNVAVFLCAYWRYREVWLLGADMSLHLQPKIEQDTNRMYLNCDHFYGARKEYAYSDSQKTIPTTMSVWLGYVSRMFFWFEQIRKFADAVGVKIVNASSYSYIDAFERPKTPAQDEVRKEGAQ